MNKIVKAISVALIVILAVSLALSSVISAGAASYPSIAKIYDAEKFLLVDSLKAGEKTADGTTNLPAFMGVEQSPLFGNSFLDKNDKKEGNSSLVQKATSGGQSLNYWACGEEKFDNKAINISSCPNPGLSMWIYISDPKNIGGDKSATNKDFGSFIMDFGSGSVGGAQNDNNRQAYWIYADSLVKGWNQIIVPVKPRNIDTEKNQVSLDNKVFGYVKSEDPIDFSAVNWWRLLIKSRNAMVVKIDDVKFVNLGTASTSTPAGTSKSSSKNSSTASVVNNTSTSAASASDSTAVSSEALTSGESVSAASDTSSASSDIDTISSKGTTGGNSSVSPLLIVGIIIGVIALCGIGFCVYFFFIKQKQN